MDDEEKGCSKEEALMWYAKGVLSIFNGTENFKKEIAIALKLEFEHYWTVHNDMKKIKVL